MSNLDTSKYFEERLQAPDFKSSFIEMLSTLRDEIGARSVQEVCNDISFLLIRGALTYKRPCIAWPVT